MLEALFILGGGSLVLGIVGALEGLSGAVDRADEGVANYGRRVEAQTRELVTQEGDERVRQVRLDTNERWTKATRKRQEEYDRQVDDLLRQQAAEARQVAAQAAQYGFETAAQRMQAAGWTPPDSNHE